MAAGDAPQSWWARLPAFVRAIVMGGAVASAATLPWVVLVTLNLKRDAAVPWSVAVMAAYLVLYWLVVSGRTWPRASAMRRRELARIEPMTPRVLDWAIVALVLGFVAAFVFLMGVYVRLVDVPASPFPETAGTPWYVVVSYLVMVGAVAGVAEEAGYRGYMQHELERAYGPAAAIAITTAVFAAAHMSLALAPFIVAVSVVLGVVAYLARSIWPGIWVHGAYDTFVTTLIWQFGYPKVGNVDLARGPDEAFVVACALTALAATGSLWAMTQLAAARAEGR